MAPAPHAPAVGSPPCIAITSTPLRSDGPTLLTLREAYAEALRRAGGLPVVVPTLPPGDVGALLARVDGVLLSGGGDVEPSRYGADRAPETGGVEPDRDDLEIELVRGAVAAGVPVLGVCRGAQVINVAFGGTLHQHLPSITDRPHLDDARSRDDVHHIDVDLASHLARALGTGWAARGALGANTLHHQAIDRVGDGLRAVAWADDGTIEGIEPVSGPPSLLGVQWHPELLVHLAPHQALFTWLVVHAASRLAATEVGARN